MSERLCAACGLHLATVRVTGSTQDGVCLCSACLSARNQAAIPSYTQDLARFFALLAPTRAQRLPALPLGPDLVCPGCRLLYRDFARDGLAGCGRCYATFADAIVPAIRDLSTQAAELLPAPPRRIRSPNTIDRNAGRSAPELSLPARRRRADLSLPEPEWLAMEGPGADVVVATRCRIARNIAGLAFPWRASGPDRRKAAELLLDAGTRCGGPFVGCRAVARDGLDPDVLLALREQRYVSREWAEPGSDRWLIVGRATVVSLLVNEEDHARIQAIRPGLLVESCCGVAEDAERHLSAALEWAFDHQVGYLTSSPVNAGTGTRVSVILHLPGLADSGSLAETLQAAEDVGCSVRGLYGEGTVGTGDLYQLSNMCAGSRSLWETARKVESFSRYVIDSERAARRDRFGTPDGRRRLATRCACALDALFHTDLPSRELLGHIGMLRLGLAEGIVGEHSVRCTARWISAAGVSAADECSGGSADERFEAVRRAAALRQQLRGFLSSAGTL